METLLEQAPKIIEEAAKSPLALLALMIIALSLLAFFFFREATSRTRVGIFLVLFLGCAVFAWAISGLDFFIQPDQATQRQLPSATVVELENLPSVPNDATIANLEKWWPIWLKSFWDKTQIIIDRGSEQGTKEGDFFLVVQQKEIKSPQSKSLGATQEPGSRIRVVETRPKLSICQLDVMARSAAGAIDARLAEIKDDRDLQNHPELVAPVIVGQQVIEIPREEMAWWEELEKSIDKTTERAITDEERKSRYAALAENADAYLQDHPTAYFAPDALYQKAWSQYQLHQYPESINTFELFLKRYPFHASAEGARDYVDKAKNAQGVGD